MGRELKGRPFLDLDRARTLPTPGLMATGRALADLVDAGAMGVVHGRGRPWQDLCGRDGPGPAQRRGSVLGDLPVAPRLCGRWRRACSKP